MLSLSLESLCICQFAFYNISPTVARLTCYNVCVQKWSSVTVASAFDGWVEHTQASQESRAKVQGSVMRLLHRTLYSAFAAWQEVAADKAQQRAKVLTCIARISNRVRTAVFCLPYDALKR